MIEIIWNGRGGQGAFTAARLLGTAWALSSGQRFSLAFPSFGPERRGAPVRAFTKMDDKHIHNRSEIQTSDLIVYLDDTLFDVSVLSTLKKGGKVILNTAKTYTDPRIVAIDADQIAQHILNRPIANTAMLGVLTAFCPDIALERIEQAIALNMPEKLAESNIAVVRAAREAVA